MAKRNWNIEFDDGTTIQIKAESKRMALCQAIVSSGRPREAIKSYQAENTVAERYYERYGTMPGIGFF